ncbi:MAG: lipopolysaccharide kinase InaA family protein [Candidatus Brocadiales bacterium]
MPKHFSVTQKGSDTFFLKEKYKYPILRQIIMEFSSEVKEGQSAFHGRGAYMAIPVSALKDRRLIVRHYSHGGLWGKLVGDILLGHNRPLRELVNTEKAQERGVDTAEVVALRFRKYFGPLCKGDIFTLEISDAQDLIVFLTNCPAEEILLQKRELIRHVAQAVRRMHDAGVYHADLHLKNILVKRGDTLKVYIIDLDKSELYANRANGGLSIERRMNNILRLDRSVEKFKEWRPDLRLITSADRLRFLREYAVGGGEDWKTLARRYATHHAAHRLWWRFLGAVGLGIYDFERRQRQ